MEKIKNPSHSKETYYYALSRTFERASYYGLKTIIMLYMVQGIFKMDESKAFNILSWSVASLVISQFIGAILGDLVIGNKKAVIVGAFSQAIGAFIFCIPSEIGLYIGLFFVILGGGLYSPNSISNVGKLYLRKSQLLDAGLTLFYLASNLGAFLGVFILGYIGENQGWNIGFIAAGLMMLVSIIPLLFSENTTFEQCQEFSITLNQRLKRIALVFILFGLFWTIYEFSYTNFFDVEHNLYVLSKLYLPQSIWTSLNSIIILPISVFAVIIWTYFYQSSFLKLMLGFLFGAISFGLLMVIPEQPSESHLVLYLISLFFLGISEVFLAPIVHSILTQYTNPKYLAIAISLAFIPTRLFSYLFVGFNEWFYREPTISLLAGMVLMAIISVVVLIYYLKRVKTK